MDPQLVQQEVHRMVQQELQQVEQPLRTEVERLVQQGLTQANAHSDEVQVLRNELENMRNQSVGLVNQLQTVQNNVQQLQQPVVPAVNANHGGQAAVVGHVKPAKPDSFSGLRGASPDEWLFSVEQYMKLTGVTNEVTKINLVGTFFTSTGYAMKWYRSVVNATPAGGNPFNGDWNTFKTQFLQRFKIIDSVKLARDKLAALKQWTSVSKYNYEFTALCIEIPDMGDADKLDRYIRGLKTQTRIEVELSNPRNLDEAMSRAQRVDNISYQSRAGTHIGTRFSNSTNGSSSSGHSDSGYAPMQLGALSQREERKYGENRIDTSRVSNGDNLNLIGNHGGRPVSRAQRVSREEFARCMKNKLCLRCKKPGHFARNCGKQQQPPKGRAQ